MNVEIRPFHQSDLEDLLDIWETASKYAHPFLSDDFLKKERENIPNLYLPNADTWVATVEDKVIGFIALLGNEIGALFVDPAHHGQGHGTALCNKAKTLHEELFVSVFKENRSGRRFYDRYGFKFVKECIFEQTGDMLLKLHIQSA
ncbi:GNAT family N-acetyltransferase [Flexibacterium corallicola]|uniref:GNAT family N-acetyltransferase n=1 Tax=Flexibacterium corallicola TaxID=3037259 RepID=UPI00286F398F|nr:GNAT family N-acetyltransferase [Pseudovibrio sp. M1P-2-3]